MLRPNWSDSFGWLLVWLLTVTPLVHVQIFHFYPVIFRWKFISFFLEVGFFLSRSMYDAVSPVTDVYVMRTLNTIFLPLHLLFTLQVYVFHLWFSLHSHIFVDFFFSSSFRSFSSRCETEVSLSFSLSCFGLFLKTLKRKKIH